MRQKKIERFGEGAFTSTYTQMSASRQNRGTALVVASPLTGAAVPGSAVACYEDDVEAIIRRAAPGDARSVAGIHVESWREAYGGGLLPARYLDSLDREALAGSWRQRITDRAREREVWVLSHRSRIAGFVEAGPNLDSDALLGFAGEVTMLYVRPRFIGRGFGHALFEHALGCLERARYYWAVVWVLEGNTRARVFYRRAGFRPDGARRFDRFTGRDVPVLRYARPLNPAIDYDSLLSRESCPR